MKEQRNSRDFSASSKDRKDVAGSPGLYVSNRFASGQKGGGIQIHKHTEGTKLSIRLKQNQLHIQQHNYQKFDNTNNSSPNTGLLAYVDSNVGKSMNSMSTF